MKIIFQGYNPRIQTFANRDSFRFLIDFGLDQYDNVKDVPKLPEGVYRVTVEPIADELSEVPIPPMFEKVSE